MKLKGLIAATHTPFDSDGALNLDIVEKQANHLLINKITAVFINGTTGECHSLTFEERLQLARRWMKATKGTDLKVVVHIGSNCIADSCALAAEAEKLGVYAIATMAPSYFKPIALDDLINWCAKIASAAPSTPFYFYDIPILTGVCFSMPEFLKRAPEKIPNLVGIKFTNSDLMSYQLCLRACNWKFDIPYGTDEWLLAALSLGGKGGVGSSYNFAAPLYHRLINSFLAGDLEKAQTEQFRSVELIKLLSSYGYLTASKAVMGMLGINVGAPRLPIRSLTSEQIKQLRTDLEQLGFFNWIK